VGRGWAPINPAGNFNLQLFSDLACSREVLLPNQGMETLHHVHADDVAQAFTCAVAARDAAIGESFHAVSPAAVTLRAYAEAMGRWFRATPRLRFVPWEEWKAANSEKDAAVTANHLAHLSNYGIAKARSRLGYEPRFSSLEAVQDSLEWLIAQGLVQHCMQLPLCNVQ
jgi:nucleoside-diphosphate-sugar epimerase